MILRKINAVLSLATTALFMKHAVFHAVWMLSRGGIPKKPDITSCILFGLMMLHAIISIALAVLGHKGAEKRKCNSYSNLNISTNIQRMSGVLLILFTVLHIAGAIGVLHPPHIVHAILPPVFFTIALMHTAVSVGKAFITLGIGNVKLFRTVDFVIKVFCGVTLVADVMGFYLFLV